MLILTNLMVMVATLLIQDKPQIGPVVVKAGPHEIEVATTDQPGQLRVTLDGKEKRVVDLPLANGSVTRIVATTWMKGVAAAIEVEAKEGSSRAFYWLTLNKTGFPMGLEKLVAVRFLAPTEEKLSLAWITNPGSDTIHILLEKRRVGEPAPGRERRPGYLYSHICPVNEQIPGLLYELTEVAVK